MLEFIRNQYTKSFPISKTHALQIAQKYCQNHHWPWTPKIKVYSRCCHWLIITNHPNRGGKVRVAVSKKEIFTWDSELKMLYKYDKKGRLKNSYILRNGDFGYSLSYANEMIFVSHSRKGRKGIWYGYNLFGF